MALEFLQSPALTKFVYPFFLIFFIIFAILEKTQIFGADKKQINALIAFVIGFIFVSAVFPKEIVNNLILFLTVGIIIVFVILMLWGFSMGGSSESINVFANAPKGLKFAIGGIVIIAVALTVFWAAGIDLGGFFDKLFSSSWSESFWTNFLFIGLVAIALAVVLSGGKKSS